MEEIQHANKKGREAFSQWQHAIQQNIYTSDSDYIHTIQYHFPDDFFKLHSELQTFGQEVPNRLEFLVAENHELTNLPKLIAYNGIGERTDKIEHHPSYVQAGDIVYATNILARMENPRGLTETVSFFFLSAHAGEAGHNCPIACSAGIIRTLKKVGDFPNKKMYLDKLTAPSFTSNFTGAQFLTEIQGGSDVGLNAVYAKQYDKDTWKIYGEKWFCSNANADLILLTARYDEKISGTKGLALFLIPAKWNGTKNNYTIRRLKEKLGTRTLATGEIDFHGANAHLIGLPQEGFHLVMSNVLHLSRIFNTITILGMARQAYKIALAYGVYRIAFSNPIIEYPLVIENLARIKAENAAMLAGIFDTVRIQDQFDQGSIHDKNLTLLLRLLANLQKYLSARWSVDHIHHALDVLAGNGTIETFSSLPRLFRDSIICENWEGTHNTLRMQVLRDILKYNIDQIYFSYIYDELKKIQDSDHSKILYEAMDELHQKLIAFRQLGKDLQTLQIQFIVDSMAIIYCALRLLFEGLDQSKSANSSSKLDCFQYFCMMHLSKPIYDEKYLSLVKRIISVDLSYI